MRKNLVLTVTLTAFTTVAGLCFANPLYGANEPMTGVSARENQAPIVDKKEEHRCPKEHGQNTELKEKQALFSGVKEDIIKVLGINDLELKTLRHEGLSLAEIARSKNVDLSLLKAAIQSRLEQNLDQAVKDGRIPDADAASIKAKLPDKIDKMLKYHHVERSKAMNSTEKH